jgi:hypothetical protein
LQKIKYNASVHHRDLVWMLAWWLSGII